MFHCGFLMLTLEPVTEMEVSRPLMGEYHCLERFPEVRLKVSISTGAHRAGKEIDHASR